MSSCSPFLQFFSKGWGEVFNNGRPLQALTLCFFFHGVGIHDGWLLMQVGKPFLLKRYSDKIIKSYLFRPSFANWCFLSLLLGFKNYYFKEKLKIQENRPELARDVITIILSNDCMWSDFKNCNLGYPWLALDNKHFSRRQTRRFLFVIF